MSGSAHESVFFYTLHKCASSLFAGYVLKHVAGLENVDHATAIFNGTHSGELTFERSGCVFGPIRISAVPGTEVHSTVVVPCSRDEFVRDRIAVFLVRDPRDILVSAYYSFGFTHPFSPVPEIRALQESRRAEIQKRTVDEYALAEARSTADHFATIARLRAACPRNVLLRYEDMIDDWPKFERDLVRYLPFADDVLAEIGARAQPRAVEDPTSHRRSGAPGGHRAKLRAATIEALDEVLAPALGAFGYAARAGRQSGGG